MEHHLIHAEDKVIFFQGRVFQNLQPPVKISFEAGKAWVASCPVSDYEMLIL